MSAPPETGQRIRHREKGWTGVVVEPPGLLGTVSRGDVWFRLDDVSGVLSRRLWTFLSEYEVTP